MSKLSINIHGIECEKKNEIVPIYLSPSKSDKSTGKISTGKISDLISNEDKNKIEESYEIDMSAVDEKKILERTETIDRKKFMCKICDTIYSRLDNIWTWGHLDMKPYKCKVCNFYILTV